MSTLDDERDAGESVGELERTFWSLVVTFNLALLAVAVGVMLVAFLGRWLQGAVLVALGAVAFLHGYRRYRRVMA